MVAVSFRYRRVHSSKVTLSFRSFCRSAIVRGTSLRPSKLPKEWNRRCAGGWTGFGYFQGREYPVLKPQSFSEKNHSLFLVGNWFSFLEISLFNGKGVELRLQRGQYIGKNKTKFVGPWLQESHEFMEAGASPAFWICFSVSTAGRWKSCYISPYMKWRVQVNRCLNIKILWLNICWKDHCPCLPSFDQFTINTYIYIHILSYLHICSSKFHFWGQSNSFLHFKMSDQPSFTKKAIPTGASGHQSDHRWLHPSQH